MWGDGMVRVGAAVLLIAESVIFLWRERRRGVERRQERRLREELEAYSRFDATLKPGHEMRELARQLCQMISNKSLFRRSMLLLRDAEGKLNRTASVGMDDLTVAALMAWSEEAVREERAGRTGLQRGVPGATCLSHGSNDAYALTGGPKGGVRIGGGSFIVSLETKLEDRERRDIAAGEGCGRVILLPLPGARGRVAGTLVVADEDLEELLEREPARVEAALPPLEGLAIKMARALDNASLTERLLRAEKLAGLGQLAGGVAHELNNPLTTVLGFAELIAESTEDTRVRADAQMIAQEALRMRDTIQTLTNFWRPTTQANEAVDMVGLLDGLASRCSAQLEHRGVRLVVQTVEAPAVRGSKGRLRLVFEHLLNNASQAVAAAQEAQLLEAGRPLTEFEQERGGRETVEVEVQEIRISVNCDGDSVLVIVSDTGPGFAEPARVFDPFYTTRQPGEGAGLGLSVCYGIVREHGGEISAFNLHPRGAAVVVELPVQATAMAAAVEKAVA